MVLMAANRNAALHQCVSRMGAWSVQVRMFIPVTIASAFLNNTPIVALLIPCASSCGLHTPPAAQHARACMHLRFTFCSFCSSKLLWGTARLLNGHTMSRPCRYWVLMLTARWRVSRIIIAWSRRAGVSSKKLLIPLSYGAVFGGTCTLIGSSTNLVISSGCLGHAECDRCPQLDLHADLPCCKLSMLHAPICRSVPLPLGWMQSW
jgi:hypothetical protein